MWVGVRSSLQFFVGGWVEGKNLKLWAFADKKWRFCDLDLQ